MQYVVTGGGTGGHVTPIRYVVTQLKKLDPDCDVVFIGQRGDRFAKILDDSEIHDRRYIFAGKYRRYPRPLWQTIIDIPTHLLNIRDAFYVLFGYLQTLFTFISSRPDAVFIKGGYVGVPVGLAAATLRIPIVTHDSDTIPGLANKLVARWAKYNTVASKDGHYPYEKDKIKAVGVPVNPKVHVKVDDDKKQRARQNIGAGDNPVVLVIGGSLGAKAINDAVCAVAEDMMREEIEIFHITGEDHTSEVASAVADVMKEHLYHIKGFISDTDHLMDHYIASDLVISRAGATNTAEIAALKKPAIIIPGSQLSDQLSNAEFLLSQEAAVILHDQEITESPEKLFEAIDIILKDSEKQRSLSDNIAKFSHPNADQKIAKLIIEAGEKK